MSSGTRGMRILLLDGGMGTTLENLGVDVSSSLWGSDLLLTDPAPIKAVHKGYVVAEADLIESATYPLSVEGIQREYPLKSLTEAEAVLHAGLHTALDSIPSGSRSKVVLALGPYGATTKPGAEYSGLYAPPYGFGTVLDSNPTATNHAEPEASKAAEDALYEFHTSRLRSYIRSERWSSVEWIGFETIPLVREIRAIRRASADVPLGEGQKVWVACTFPDGSSPETTTDGTRISVEDTVQALLHEGGGRKLDGIGINCTNPAYVPTLINTFNTTLRSLDLGWKPWFVLYPDGGQVYEPISRSWSKEKLTAGEWADRMMGAIETVDKSGLWEGVIAGGCCKTSADEIGELRRRVDQYLEKGE